MSNNPHSLFARLVAISLVLSLALVVLSSLMRLSNQGLGCADWPACYGYVDVIKYAGDIGASGSRVAQPEALAPVTFVERAHRVVASLLLLFIIAIVVVAWQRRKDLEQRIALPLAIFGVSLFLAVLGIWYGSPLLRPPVVMGNLLGGMALLGLLWWLRLSVGSRSVQRISHNPESLRKWAVLGLVLVIAQIALGGWVSSNFAALACKTFPLCNGSLWPEMNIAKGFTVQHTLDVSAEGKVFIDQAAVTGIHMVHRISAIFVLLFVGWLGYRAVKLGGRFRTTGMASLAILISQVLVGVAIVILSSPLSVVVTHNTLAALLCLSIIKLIYETKRSPEIG
jgi:cytochrome c oxidase assembly protein subunit 15